MHIGQEIFNGSYSKTKMSLYNTLTFDACKTNIMVSIKWEYFEKNINYTLKFENNNFFKRLKQLKK